MGWGGGEYIAAMRGGKNKTSHPYSPPFHARRRLETGPAQQLRHPPENIYIPKIKLPGCGDPPTSLLPGGVGGAVTRASSPPLQHAPMAPHGSAGRGRGWGGSRVSLPACHLGQHQRIPGASQKGPGSNSGTREKARPTRRAEAVMWRKSRCGAQDETGTGAPSVPEMAAPTFSSFG